jgi:hypothetical protein
MSESIQYITNEHGDRTGVLLDIDTYAKLTNFVELDEDFLFGLEINELQALASCKLATEDQSRLDDLVARNTDSLLSANEIAELDELLAQADQLTVLKTRARYTLKHFRKGNAVA